MMKKIITTVLTAFIALSAAAQGADTTTTVVGEKLNFEEPNFMVSTYLESVRAHLSAEGRKGWKPEFSFRFNLMPFNGMVDLTGGIRTSQNKVFGLGVGLSETFYDAIPAKARRVNVYLYHRHYIPFDKRRRVSLYSDIMGGGSCVYKLNGSFDERHPAPVEKGKVYLWLSWQPGLSIRMWGKSNFFLGPTLVYSRSGFAYGLHAGIAL